MTKYVVNKVNEAYVKEDSRTFLCADLFRTQLWGVFEALESGDILSFFKKTGFSHTGAARTVSLDVKMFAQYLVLDSLMDIPEQYKEIFDT